MPNWTFLQQLKHDDLLHCFVYCDKFWILGKLQAVWLGKYTNAKVSKTAVPRGATWGWLQNEIHHTELQKLVGDLSGQGLSPWYGWSL